MGYLNFYVCNDAVIVPIAEDEVDEDALAIIAAAFPETVGGAGCPERRSRTAVGGRTASPSRCRQS